MNSHVPENPEALLDELIRSDFVTFLRRAFLGTSPANEFKHGWYIDALAHYLDRLADGEIERLVVNLPPRHLKSITVSVAWVAFMLGINPKLKFVCVSYSETVSLIFANLCRQIMETEWYCRAFPHTRLDPKRNKEDHFYTTAGGYRYSTSVGGSLTGIGGDIIIVDDPIKAEDAHSETIRRNCLEWYCTTLCSRTDDRNNSAFVFVMQRLHQDDLAGYVEDNDECEVVKFPAIATHDEQIPVGGGKFYQRRKGNALNPAHMSIQQLRREQLRIGDMAFSSQYQQDPISPEGNIFKSSWLILHDSPPDRANGGYIIQSWDTAGRDGINNDYSVGITAHVFGKMVYVLDVYRAKLTFPDLKAKVVELAQLWRTDVLAIEDAGSGMYLLDQFRREPIMHVPHPHAMRVDTNKTTRFASETEMIRMGKLSFPRGAHWLNDLLDELRAFPNGRNDDQVDALAHLLAYVRTHMPEKIVGPMVFEQDDTDGGGPTSDDDNYAYNNSM